MTAPETAETPPPIDAFGGWKTVLGRLTAGESLAASEAAAGMETILQGRATAAQIAGFIVALRMKGESVEEMVGLVDAMVDHSEPIPVAPDGLIDNCGTGGDGSGSVNVSTMAALVAAGAGATVCKHGNRAASSQCGSADVLEALGVTIELSPAGVAACLAEAGIAFCFARSFHPAMRFAGPVRAELGVRTVFNFLGPLANPARVRRQVVGVSDPAMAQRMLDVLVRRGAERALVVYGHDGLDELTTAGTSTVLDFDGNDTRTYEVDPSSLGLNRPADGAFDGGDAAFNARVVEELLSGAAGPVRDIAALNAAAAIVVAGLADDLAGGLDLAFASIDDGRAAATLEKMRVTSAAG